MVSPYAMGSVGGVQGQVVGLARSLRAYGHEVTVVAPAGTPPRCLPTWGTTSSSGRPCACAPTARWRPSRSSPSAAGRAERFVRRGHFDVVHVHEPLAPMAAYGLVLRAPRADGRDVSPGGRQPVGPSAASVDRSWSGVGMQVRVAVSEAARATGPA